MRAVAPVVHAPRGAAPAPRRVRSASRNSILSRAAAEPLGSLVPDTLREMETDEEFKLAKERLETEGQAALTREERARRRRALTGMDVPSFDAFVAERGVSPLRRKPTTILQVNIGLYCNQACSHCHVESSPLRKEEVMSAKTANRLIELIDNAQGSIKMLDITGGAPEMMAPCWPPPRASSR